jgi:mono/diheme cytochrome c family protein
MFHNRVRLNRDPGSERRFALPKITSTFAILVTLLASHAFADDPLPVARWDFGAEEATSLQSHGDVHRDASGPRSPEYPDFPPENTAIRLDGKGAHFSLDDDGIQSPFDFTNGDAITLEAWVQVDSLRSGENVYVIGKGRTGSPNFRSDNQNWALRVRETNGKAGVSFLFATATENNESKPDAQWHRWTTTEGFAPGKYWHHIAVSYQFGDPESIRGWIDGKPRVGAWDKGGPTVEAPIVDDDAIWIGSSQKGAAANSFRGSLDAIAVYRSILDDKILSTRFRRVGEEIVVQPAPEIMPELGALPTAGTLVTLHEGMPDHSRWLNNDEELPSETLRWTTQSFLLDRLPQRYDDWGIRADWKPPVLVRFAADVPMVPGKHRFLLRVRGLSRLWVDGILIARSKAISGSPSGEEPMTPVPDPPLPNLRIAEHRQQEIYGEAVVDDKGVCRVVLEMLVGGKAFRTDPGESCVAVETEDGRSFQLLSPNVAKPVMLTDADVTEQLPLLEKSLREFDAENRNRAASSQDEFWKTRHDLARAWAVQHPAPPAPDSSSHPIDAFLAAKVERAVKAASETPIAAAREFHDHILPILRDHCFRCHGDKVNGGLVLNSREAAIRGGESGMPALSPGKVQESELIRRVRAENPDERMPPGDDALSPREIEVLEAWIQAGATWPALPVTAQDVAQPALISDTTFLRRVFLDTVGVPPSKQEVLDFLADPSADKRTRIIDQLLTDGRRADHWMSYWQDVLAENPTLINASLNTTGPFRWFLYDALCDNKPVDRMVTELILLRGSQHAGGSAGFGIAANNDAPFAAKAQIVASAFLGIDLQCARCHDSPFHSTQQRDLYSLAAMFEQKPITVPASSRVPEAFFTKQQRESLIKVTLSPDESVSPAWPFPDLTGSANDDALGDLQQTSDSTREQLAALITSPRNQRFAQVIVNRVWRRLLGAGIVEPPDDWEGHAPSHPELLHWLALEFVTHDYDIRHVERLILSANVYQRVATGTNLRAPPELRFFVAPDRRRMSAEQLVDSLCSAAGQKLDVEELTFDPDARRPASNRLTLGVPRRAWMMASLANERDRPSLGLPRARSIADIMEAFGWTGSRQNPRTDRETAPNVLQPGVLANSTASILLTRASQNSGLAEIAVSASTPEELVDTIFLRYLSRLPNAAEREPLAEALTAGFHERVRRADEIAAVPAPIRLPAVTWSNHLSPESTTIALQLEQRARTGALPDPRLHPEWREVFEDVVWSVINISEFVWIP